MMVFFGRNYQMGANGSCLCGRVKYKIAGPLRDVIGCHCSQCRKQTGHYFAATSASDKDLVVEGAENVTWFAASDAARRGFCKTCGSTLFWKRNGSDTTSILAGSLDDEGGVKLTSHIFVADKGDYYDLDDDLPKFDSVP